MDVRRTLKESRRALLRKSIIDFLQKFPGSRAADLRKVFGSGFLHAFGMSLSDLRREAGIIPKEHDSYITASEARRILGVTRERIRQLCQRRQLEAYRQASRWWVKREDVESRKSLR